MDIVIVRPIDILTNNTIIIETFDIFADILGFTGGLTLALCLVPQIIKVIRTKSAKDLSFSWLFISFAGLLQMATYIVYNCLIPLFFSMFIELVLYLSLIILKYVYDKQNNNINSKSTTPLFPQDPQ